MRILFFLFTVSFYLFGQDVEVLSSRYYVDTNHTWTVQNAYEHKEEFSILSKKHESLGFDKSTIWIYIKVKNITNMSSQFMLEFPYPLHDHISIYKYKNHKSFNQYTTGDLTQFNTRHIKTHNFVFPFQLETEESMEFIFKIDSNSALNIGTKVFSIDNYYNEYRNNKLFLGLFYGAVLIMLFYNLNLYFIIKEKVYLDYFTFHLSYIFLHLGLNGLAFQYFYPSLPNLNLYFIPIVFILANYFSLMFGISFLGLNKYRPKIARSLTLLSYAFLLLLLLTLLLSYYHIMILVTILSMISITYLFLIGLYIYYKVGSSSSKIYVLAWSFLLIGALIGELQNLGFIPMSTFSYYSAQIGTLVELTLLSWALGYRYKIVYMRLVDSERNLKIFNSDLEKTIAERMEDIDTQNKELEKEIGNKNILFRELYHRVKNNLQIVSSLLTLQVKRVDDIKAKEILNETTQRIKAMSMIHEKLYHSENLSAVSMQHYAKDLVDNLQQEFRRKNLEFNIECENIELKLEVAVPMGLIVNELVTNAIKYAFDEEDKNQMITIKMYTTEDNTFVLEVYDSGKGIAVDIVQDGFGFKLVHSLAKYQLKGNISMYNDDGLHHKITFPKGLV